jgi:hypothetical protein
MIFPRQGLSWDAATTLETVVTFIGYAVLVLAIGIAVCAVIGILLRGVSRFVDWVHEVRVHGFSGRKKFRRAGKR